MKNIFITGKKGVGKSTLLKKIIEEIDCSIGGFVEEKLLGKELYFFNVISLYDLNDIYIIGSYDVKKKSLHPLIENFNIISENILLKSLYHRELIVLDELGFLEEGSELFKETIYKILDSNKPVLGVLKECNTDFINKIKSRNDVHIIKIDEDNRNLMKDEILELLQSNRKLCKLIIKNLCFEYKDHKVLKNINFSIEKGCICGLIGPNGSGKTTLLKSIIKARQPSQGDIIIDDISIKNMNYKQLAKMVSMVPQQTNVVFPYTVEDMVLMGKSPTLHWNKSPDSKDKAECEKLLKDLGVYHLKNRRFNELSGGEKQLIMIGRALFQNTKIMLLDEPIAHLDYKNQFFIMDLIKDISEKRDLTVLITLHDPNIATYYCNKLIMLKCGELIFHGSSKEAAVINELSSLYSIKLKSQSIRDNFQLVFPNNWCKISGGNET